MKIKKLVLAIIIAILFSIVCAKVAMAKTAIVNTDTLNLRKEPSTDATVLELLNQGDKLDVLAEEGKWVKIKFKGMTGYVSKEYVKITEDDKKNEKENNIENTTTTGETTTSENTNTTVKSNNTTIVNEENAKKETNNTKVASREGTINTDTKIYILPIINASKLNDVKKDEKLTIIDEIKSWYYVQTENTSGWVRKVLVDVKEVAIETATTPKEQETDTKNKESNNSEQDANKKNEQANEAVNEKENTTSNNTTSGTTTAEETIKETPITEKTMYVNYSSVYVRKGPGTNYDYVDSLILNSDVTVIAEAGDWYKVKVSGITGYIAKRLLSNTITREETTSRSAEERNIEEETIINDNTTSNENSEVASTSNVSTSKGQEIVDFAKKYLGCKYVYGGSGPSTFDCSGFTMYVFKNFGISLSHSANAQSKKGVYVAQGDLQPGDLVFFKDYQTMDGIGHCGIYIGDGNFIHASSGTGYCVKISTLLSGSYKTRYETARRLI